MKIKLELKDKNDSELLDFSAAIYTAIATNALIPTPKPTPAQMKTNHDGMITALGLVDAQQIVMNGLKADVDAWREKIVADINTQGSTVQTALNATGNPDCAIKSGIPLQDEGTRTTSMDTPTGCVATTGDEAGEVDWQCNPPPRTRYFTVESCIGDPNVAANWKPAKGSTKSSGSVKGFPPASIVWLRIAAEGPNDLTSAWSDPCKAVAGI